MTYFTSKENDSYKDGYSDFKNGNLDHFRKQYFGSDEDKAYFDGYRDAEREKKRYNEDDIPYLKSDEYFQEMNQEEEHYFPQEDNHYLEDEPNIEEREEERNEDYPNTNKDDDILSLFL